MPAFIPHPYRSWNRSWLTWSLVNGIGAAGTMLYATIASEVLSYPAFVCLAAAAGSMLLLPISWFVLAGILDSRTQGWRLLAFWGTILATYIIIALLLITLGRFYGIIALFTGWPYLPAALVGATLAYKQWLFRGNDDEIHILSVNKLP